MLRTGHFERKAEEKKFGFIHIIFVNFALSCIKTCTAEKMIGYVIPDSTVYPVPSPLMP